MIELAQLNRGQCDSVKGVRLAHAAERGGDRTWRRYERILARVWRRSTGARADGDAAADERGALGKGNGHAAGRRGGDRRGIGRVDRRAEADRRRGRRRGAGGARPRGRAHVHAPRRRRHADRPRRPVDRPVAGSPRRAGRRTWMRDLQDLRHRQERPVDQGDARRVFRGDPDLGPAARGRCDRGAARSDDDVVAGAAGRAVDGSLGGGVGRADDGDVDAGEHRLARRAQPGGAGGAGGLLGGAGGAVAAALPLLHALGRRHHEPDRRDGRRAGEPLRGGGAVDLAEDGGGARRPRGAECSGPLHRAERGAGCAW